MPDGPRRPKGWLGTTVLDILSRTTRPLTGCQIAARFDPADGMIYSSAIFRVLDHLVATNAVRRIECAKGYVVSSGAPKIDLLCGDCGALVELAGEETRTGLESMANDRGFVPSRFVAEVVGRCCNCAAAQ